MSLQLEAKYLLKYSKQLDENTRQMHKVSEKVERLEKKEKHVKVGFAKQKLQGLAEERKEIANKIKHHYHRFHRLMKKQH